MSVIGEAALSAFFELLGGKLLDSALNFVADHKQLHPQLKQWQSILPDIQAVLDDAEEKQIKSEGVKKWLNDLQDLAYDVDDILDEFAYEQLRLKLQKSHTRASTSKVRKLIPSCFTSRNFTSTSFQFKNSMIPKVKEITDRLTSLATRRSSLGLSEILSQAPTSKEKQPRLQPTSVMDETVEYVGRRKEKQEMIELLKGDNSNGVSVLSIVGMGGMGKTTLAQLVYNDAPINESFDLKAWVCVSDHFDAVNITRTILKSIDPDSREENDLNLLQVKLKEKLSGKRFLLVLDDIWNENYNDWTILRSPFGAGTNIIVTTRLQMVSSIVNPLKAFYLDKLSDDDCLSIIIQHALKAKKFDGHIQIKEIGEKIVRRCNGLPLAAKAIGSLLRTVKDYAEWERIYESEIWNLPEEQCGIIPALRLSYHHLPSYLKQCFAYCSILPKDYEFEEEEVVLLWRAEGLLQQKAMPQIKDIGNQYFQDLVSRSFFQISSKDKSRFVMHDLINDLAQVIAGDICSRLEGDKQQQLSNRTRHSSYIVGTFGTFEAFNQVKSLRTFLPLQLSRYWRPSLTNVVLVDLLPRLGYLRVLSLSAYSITELPDVFENLKLLRYLNFSHNDIKCLPDSLCTLYHLETLLLKGCSMLQKLPSKIGNLINLQNLDIRSANLIESMPFGIGKLTNLQRLSDFITREGDGCHMRDLKYLSNLKGDFRLSGLENDNCRDAREAKLNEKQGIDRLVLHWSKKFEKDSRNEEDEERVLDSLCPPVKLQQLIIENYGGAKFSTWIADSSFKNMLSLELRNCKNCKSLPSIARLSLLKDLSICGLDEVHKIGVELFGANQSNAFASLETLYFCGLPNWEEWDPCEWDERTSKFPSLRELSILECPQLLGRLPTLLQSLQKLVICDCRRLVVSISSFSSLRELRINGCEELVDEGSSSVQEVTSLKRVTLKNISKFDISAEKAMLRFVNAEAFDISGWKELESLSQNGLSLVGHRFITIVDCPQLVSLETEEERLQLDKIPGVESLEIRDCERLNRLPEILHAFPFITRIKLEKCPGLVCFAKRNFPPALKELEICECENLQYLVDENVNNKSMSSNTCLLEHLEIRDCPSLIWLSSRGDICNRLQHLKIESGSKLRSLFLNSKLPVMLKHLVILDCPLLESIAQNFHETVDLESIRISNAENIKSLPRGLDKLSHLQEIEVDGCLSDHCENFRALPKCINNFTSLRELKVRECSADLSFPEEGSPTNLASLEILNAPKIYTSLVEWGLNRFTSLQELQISGEGCSSLMSFPEEGIGMTLPPSLTSICIENFENLEYMCSKGFQHLTSLQQLRIYACPKLTSLPEKDMLLSLDSLSIWGCPLLEEGCSRGKGREWSKIAHIPFVFIQGKRV
ncbi:hypothetical protein ES319_A11G339100v1 [Gossypium barbadense]|uniref:Disease resistance RPP13-like protein 1 n=1 Tax=Gossypium barbadense TaxID=3634 RepID=A0A5J5TYH1_GOSBA|nr:hypothetical protein ES319_A11G339100v1 [Gossypium barbadense]